MRNRIKVSSLKFVETNKHEILFTEVSAGTKKTHLYIQKV